VQQTEIYEYFFYLFVREAIAGNFRRTLNLTNIILSRGEWEQGIDMNLVEELIHELSLLAAAMLERRPRSSRHKKYFLCNLTRT